MEGIASLEARFWRKNASIHLQTAGAARPWLCRGFEHPLLIILPNTRFVRDFAADAEVIRSYAAIPEISQFSEMPIVSFSEDKQAYEAAKALRGEAIGRWNDRGGILLATPGSLMGPISLGGERKVIALGSGVSRSALLEWLARHDYEKTDLVWTPGQYTYRGGIVDFYDPSYPWPVRVEFFDDDIESMRYFATDTQRSVRNLERLEIRGLSSRQAAKLTDFFPPAMHVIFAEPAELDNTADNYAWLLAGMEMAPGDVRVSWLDAERALSLFPRLRLTAGVEHAEMRSGITGIPNFRGRVRDLEAYCDDMAGRGVEVFIFSEAEHFRIWGVNRGHKVSEGSLSEGFYDHDEKKIFIGDLELSGMVVSGTKDGARVPLDWGDRLVPGQWVVHEDYGVAKYMGSEQIVSPEGVQEYLVLEYAEERRLKIPVMHFHKISPYRTYPGAEPAADNLRGGQWKKMSSRAKEQAEMAARYLVEVYARRETTPGRTFKGDAEAESAFERTFPYKETSDQIKAIDEILYDMSRPAPMDRLLVGDVGFGKTEVALRAAARCVFDGAQVALIAPTTLLAEQHHATWGARFDPFGVRVEVVSRFVSTAKARKIVEDAASGGVDILLGTHRILGRDVSFKNLGLVIVDEEHRFGVMHKEHLKKLYPGVDVLMLSATPIPRSLHMSLSGLRDMSVIETPPRKRLPVITASGMWSETLVKNAALREISRGGQIFYVHNRVTSIDREALTVKRMFPALRVGVAHGQMPESALKGAMDKFSEGKLDILVCTTIIESGLDMPRANTLIVSDSQDLGLAQMHQLRGRVGRREEQAFALFLYPEGTILTKEATERLEAIAALGEFGAGYELARRDLEIRGGGELVGVAQHGNLGRVGFQRYCDLLEEAIQKIKGDTRERTQVEVALPTAIPSEYIPQESLRVALYRKLLWTRDAGALDSLYDETADRFGRPPKPLQFLFDVSRVRIIGPDYGISKVLCGAGETTVQCVPDSPLMTVHPPKGWYRHAQGFLGPGGLSSLGRFVTHIVEPKV